MARCWKPRAKKLDYFHKDQKGKLGDYLNDPENAARLFDPTGGPEGTRSQRAKLLSQLLERLEQQDVLYHVLASYEIRAIASTYHPPVHLQQLRKALVSKDELKRVEQVLKQVPAKRLSEKPIDELSRKSDVIRATNCKITCCALPWIFCGCIAICVTPNT